MPTVSRTVPFTWSLKTLPSGHRAGAGYHFRELLKILSLFWKKPQAALSSAAIIPQIRKEVEYPELDL